MRRILSKLRDQYDLRYDPIRFARRRGVTIGEDCRLLDVSSSTFGSEPYLITLGDHVTITGGVRFLTHDGGVWVFRETHPELDVVAPIRVGSNVFIGLNAILLPGITIGDHCVVAAGAVVTRSVESGTIVAGVPARPIKRIEEYQNACIASGEPTKGFSRQQKHRYYLNKYKAA